MKIGDYEQMMSYLTRKSFKEGTPDTSKPKPKPLTEDFFKEKADLYIKGLIGGFPKDEMLLKLQGILDKAVEQGIVKPEEGINYFRNRKQELLDFAKENPGETLPSLNREEFAEGSPKPQVTEEIKKQFPEGDFDKYKYGFSTKDPKYEKVRSLARTEQRAFYEKTPERVEKRRELHRKYYQEDPQKVLTRARISAAKPERVAKKKAYEKKQYYELGKREKDLARLRGEAFKKNVGSWQLTQDNVLLSDMVRAAQKGDTSLEIVRGGPNNSIVGVKEGNKIYHPVTGTGKPIADVPEKSIPITKHPLHKKRLSFKKQANAFANTKVPGTNITYGKALDVLQSEKAGTPLQKKNPAEFEHTKGVATDYSKGQIALRTANREKDVILNSLKQGFITKEEADKKLKKIGVKAFFKNRYIGAPTINPEKQFDDFKKYVDRQLNLNPELIKQTKIEKAKTIPGVTTADKIERPQSALDRESFKNFEKRTAPKLKGVLIPGLEEIKEGLKSLPSDIAKKKYFAAGLKTLGIVATPLIVAGMYNDLSSGKSVVETLERNLIGTDIVGATKDVFALSPQEKEARSVVKQNELDKQVAQDFSDLDSDFQAPRVRSEMSLEEAAKKYEQGMSRVKAERASQEADIARARSINIQALKNLITGERFQPQPLPQQFMANGGRIGFYVGGGADMGGVADSQGNVGSSFGGGNNDGPDDRSTAAQTAAHNAAVAAAQAANKAAEEKMNILDTLSRFRPDTYVNPYNYSVGLNKNIGPFGLNVGINTLGMLGIDDPRTKEDESEQPDYGINAGYNTDVFGGNLSLGAGYNPMSGANFGLSFSKQFSQGGRVNFADGYDPKRRKFIKAAAGIASIPVFGRMLKPVVKGMEAAGPAIEKVATEAEKIFFNLVDAVKSKGIMDKLDKMTGGRLSGAYHEYKGAEVLEDAGSITARFKTDKGAPAEVVYIKPQKGIDPKTGKEVEYPGQFEYEAQEVYKMTGDGNDYYKDFEDEIIDSIEDVKKIIDD